MVPHTTSAFSAPSRALKMVKMVSFTLQIVDHNPERPPTRRQDSFRGNQSRENPFPADVHREKCSARFAGGGGPTKWWLCVNRKLLPVVSVFKMELFKEKH